MVDQAMTVQQISTLQALHNQAIAKARLWQATRHVSGDSTKAMLEVEYHKAEANFTDYLLSLRA